eukprot:427852_1
MKRATNVIRRILRANFVVLLIFFGCLDGLELVEEDTSATTTGMAMRENMKQSILELDDGGDLIQNNATRHENILAALWGLPEEERIHARLERIIQLPLEERNRALDELWAFRQDILKDLTESMIEHADVLGRLIETLRRVDEVKGGMGDDESIVGALQELEDLLSDVDQAKDFHTLGGWIALSELLKRDKPLVIRRMAAAVAGTAMQNVPEYQEWALQDGVLQNLLEALTSEKLDIPLSSDCGKNSHLKEARLLELRAVFAVGAASRNSPNVQHLFRELNGFELLGSAVDRLRGDEDGVISSLNNKLRVKAATLVSDLSRNDVLPLDAEWCRRLLKLMTLPGLTVGQLEKAIEAATEVQKGPCKDEFAGKNFQAEKTLIRQRLSHLNAEGLGHHNPDQEDYYLEVLFKLENLERDLFGGIADEL